MCDVGARRDRARKNGGKTAKVPIHDKTATKKEKFRSATQRRQNRESSDTPQRKLGSGSPPAMPSEAVVRMALRERTGCETRAAKSIKKIQRWNKQAAASKFWTGRAESDRVGSRACACCCCRAQGTERGELDRVRLVPDGEPELFEAAFDVLPHDAGLHAHEQVLLVDPQDLVHPVHVHTDYHASLVGRALQRAGDGGAAAEGDQDDVVFASEPDQDLNLGVAGGPNYCVRYAMKLAEPQGIYLLAGVPVGMEKAVCVRERDGQ